MKGIAKGFTDNGIRVLRVHYTADPDKDPATLAGAEWLAHELMGYPGGRNGPDWKREYEIDAEAASGQLVFPLMSYHEDRIAIKPFPAPETWELAGSFDYAGRGYSAFLVHARAKGDCDFYTIWEYFQANSGLGATADAIKNNPYFDRLNFIVADPSIWAENQIREGGGDDLVSVAQLFAERGVAFTPGRKGGDRAFAELVNCELWRGVETGGQPAYRVFSTCQEHIRELRTWRYNDWSPTTALHKSPKETMVDKDNHTLDCLKYYLQKTMSRWLDEWVQNFKRDLHTERSE